MNKPACQKVPRGSTKSGKPGRVIRPPHTADNLRASGQPPQSVRLDATLFNAYTERRKSPNPPKKAAKRGARRMVLQTDGELERWLDFRLHLVNAEMAACEEARQKGEESFRITQGCKGDIVEIFFKIDVNTYSPQTKLSELQNLTLSEIQTTSERYLPIHVPSQAFYLALDCNFQRLFILFSDPYSLLYGPDIGSKVQDQVRENITNYALIQPPEVPNNKRYRCYEKWLLENPMLRSNPESRCGVFHWGVWMQRGHEALGPVITVDTNKVGAQLRVHQHDLFTSLHNISYLKRFLLGAIDKTERDKMQKATQALSDGHKDLWCKSDTECFSLRACLVNVLTEPHVDCSDVEWAMISPFGNFDNGEFCIADLERRFTFQEGHIAGIRGRRFVHFTRKWSGSRICLVSTMHSAVFRQCAKRHDSEEIVSVPGTGESEKAELPRKRAKR